MSIAAAVSSLDKSWTPSAANMKVGIPDSCANVEDLTDRVLHEARVFITPGFIFGSNGQRYIRISLCAKEEKLAEALERVKAMN